MSATWKTVRVFISSTFRDMQAERDHLVRFVFPRLREELLARRIHLVDVDLRWGVTSDQDASEVCREVVDECHPRFLCMLGGRYGWVPKGKPRSITADEIHYGVLDREVTKRGFAFFYFRDENATAAMVETTPGEFRELQGSDSQIALAKLKQTIADAELNPFNYPAQWDEPSHRLIGLSKFGNQVHDDLLRSMEDDPELRDRFTESVEKLDEFAEENAAMEAFIAERTERFVLGSRKAVMDELLAHANGTGGNGYLCLVGEPGSGKSALLAHLSQHPTLNNEQSTLLIPHFIGASTGSTDVRRTLRRLCHEIYDGCKLEEDKEEQLKTVTGDDEDARKARLEIEADYEIPDDPEKLRLQFPRFLKKSTGKKRVLILLDAVNQFDATSQLAELWWLPEELPDNARIIISTLPGPTLDDLKRRRNPPREVPLPALTQTDGEAIIKEFLHRYRKTMTDAQRATLLKKKDAGIPLYLLAALEELRTLGTYEEITDRIGLLPTETQALFTWILNRLEDDDGFRDGSGQKIGTELVSRFASLMCVSRHGLSQRELAELLSPGDSKAAIPDDSQGNVAALVQLLRPYLMRRGELLDFYHGQFRESARAAHLHTPEKQRAAHQSVAACLQAFADPHRDGQCRDATPHALSELPRHQTHAEAWHELIATLENIFFLEAKVTHGMVFDLAEDFNAALKALPLEHIKRLRLRLLEEALRRNIHFIARHAHDYPQAMFQCLWNTAWWYDCPDAASHYVIPKGGWKNTPPWENQNPTEKLCALLEHWREKRETAHIGFYWLRSMRPPYTILGCGQHVILQGHDREVNSAMFSPDGKRIVSGSSDGTVRVWDSGSGRELAALRGHVDGEAVFSVAFSPDNRHVISGSSDATVRLWDVDSGLEMALLRGHKSSVRCVAFSPDGHQVLSGSSDGSVRLWNAYTGQEQAVLHGHESEVICVAFSPDGCRLLSGSRDKTVRLWDAQNGVELVKFTGHEDIVSSVAFSPDGRRVLSGSYDKTVRLWDSTSGEKLLIISGHEREVSSAAFSAKGDYLISGSDRTVRLWDAQTGRDLGVLRGHENFVTGVAFSNDNSIFLSTSFDKTTRLWNTDNIREIAMLNDHSDEVATTAISPDGRYVSSGTRIYSGNRLSNDASVRLWDAHNARQLAVLLGHQADVFCLSFSKDSRLIASGSYDKTVRIWDTELGQLRAVLSGHEGEVCCVDFSPDGRHLASASGDATIRLWDVASGNELAILQCNPTWGDYGVKFSDDGNCILSYGLGRDVVWDIRRGEFLERNNKNLLIAKELNDNCNDWDACVKQGETIIRHSESEEYKAIFPKALNHWVMDFHIEHHGRVFVGGVSNHLVFLRLEGG